MSLNTENALMFTYKHFSWSTQPQGLEAESKKVF